jgi:RNA polymerase sigma-70 factor, ECF subfamily
MNEAFGEVLMEAKPMQHYSPAQSAPLERQAFQSLYRENLGPIYRYVFSKVRNCEEAEDLTSHIFIKAVRHIDHAYNPQSVRSWLFQVAHTTIADYWRAFYRSATSSLDALVDAGWEGPAEYEDGDRLFEKSSSTDHVQHLLQALSERDREVLTCRFLLGLSVRETAARMGLNEENVKTSQFRALKRAADLEGVEIPADGSSHI